MPGARLGRPVPPQDGVRQEDASQVTRVTRAVRHQERLAARYDRFEVIAPVVPAGTSSGFAEKATPCRRDQGKSGH